MKKMIIFLLLFALAAALCGCGQQRQKTGSLDDIYQEMEKTSVLPPMITVDADLALDFYGIAKSDYTEALMKIAEDSLLADEVLLFRARDQITAEKIARLLADRLAAKGEEAKGYSPEQFAIIQKGALIQNDLAIALIVSPKVDRLTAIYHQYVAP